MSPTVAPLAPLSPVSNLSTKSILITGGATGLGLATVRTLSAAGAYITIATNIPIEASTLHSLQESNPHIQAVLCDVSNWDSLLKAFKAALAFSPTGTLDIVAMFAAVDIIGMNLVDEVTATDVNAEPVPPRTTEIDINLKGTLYTTALALHYFRVPPRTGTPTPQTEDSLKKSLIFVASLAGYIDDTHNSIYTASKFGVRGLWRSIRSQAAVGQGVVSSLIAPWAVKTPMTAPILQVLDQMGIKEGQGITFASEENLVQAVLRCIGDESMSGK
ncbi:MAG: hypothetical protein Q9160_003676 [Pyrenula sp. 1 TL-2023]